MKRFFYVHKRETHNIKVDTPNFREMFNSRHYSFGVDFTKTSSGDIRVIESIKISTPRCESIKISIDDDESKVLSRKKTKKS